MKITVKSLGIIALTAMIVFSLVSCDTGGNGLVPPGTIDPPGIEDIPDTGNMFDDTEGLSIPNATEFREYVLPGILSIFGNLLEELTWPVWDEFEDMIDEMFERNRTSASKSIALANLTSLANRNAMGIRDLSGTFSLSASFNRNTETFIGSMSSNNIGFEYFSDLVTNQYFEFEDGDLVGRMAMAGSFTYIESDTKFEEEGTQTVDFAVAFRTDSFYGQVVISMAYNFTEGDIYDNGRWEWDSESTASFTAYLYNADDVREWRWQATASQSLDIWEDFFVGGAGSSPTPFPPCYNCGCHGGMCGPFCYCYCEGCGCPGGGVCGPSCYCVEWCDDCGCNGDNVISCVDCYCI